MPHDLDPQILGKLLLIQSTLHVMPDEEKMADFLLHGLTSIPGIKAVGLCLQQKQFLSNLAISPNNIDTNLCKRCRQSSLQSIPCIFESFHEYCCIDIRFSVTHYGMLIIETDTSNAFSPYKPFLENTANLLALILENRMQHEELTVHRRSLEKEVQERTTALLEEITERKRIEHQLKIQEEVLFERNQFIETIIDLSPVIIYIYDLFDRKNIYSNEGIQTILGYSVDEIKQMGDQLIALLMHKDDFKIYLEQILPMYSKTPDNEIVFQTYRMRHKNGEWRWLESKEIIFKRLADGTAKQILGVIHDITERKNAEEQFRESEEKLHQVEKMQAIGQLAGGIAHDFNNQLAGIVGYADMLREELYDNPTLSRYASNILLATTRASDLTSQLLAFARKGKYLSVKVDMPKIISEVAGILHHTIDRRIVIKQNFSVTHAMTLGDPSQIQNAIMNLALNARDAMPNGGELIFSLETTEIDEAFCLANPYDAIPGNYAKVSVTDTGMGIDESIQHRIFEPFFTTKEPGKGTGMGLASVYGTVKNHGGTIQVASQPGHGTTLSLFFPLIDETPVSATADNELTESTQGSAHILLVDDEEFVLDIATIMLTKCGYSVSTCQNGAEAVAFYKDNWNTINLVILDMVMPELNGRDTFLKMKEINPSVSVLLSSGFSVDGEAQQILDEGVKGFIQKPYRKAELANKVALALT